MLGELIAGDGESVTIKDEIGEIRIPSDKISRLNTVYAEES